MEESSKIALIKGCRKNKRKAQNELFKQYQGLVMSITRRYCSDPENIDDTFQEAFIEVFKSLINCKEDIKDLDRWIARIVINTNISVYRKNRKHHHLRNDYVDMLDESHESVLDALSGEEISRIIELLPNGYRTVFNLFFVDGYTHQEISQRLNISIKTSRSQLVRAKQYLRNELEKIGIYRYEAS